MYLQLCREYGQPLSWWDTLEPEDQAIYMADLRIRERTQRKGR